MDTTPVELHTDTNPVSPTHTGRASGFLTAFGALAALVGSACSGGSETNASTTSERPTTTVDTTTPVTTIDSTTTIVVESTTTIDAPTVVTFSLDSPVGRLSAISMLLTGRRPTFDANGAMTFDRSDPSVAIDQIDVDQKLIDQLTSFGYWDYLVSITTDGNDFWLDATEPSGGVRVIANNIDQLRQLAATYGQTGGGFASWVALVEANPETTISVVEMCASFQNSEGVVVDPRALVVLLDMTDGIGKISGDSPYAKVNPDGSRVADPVSPVSGLEC